MKDALESTAAWARETGQEPLPAWDSLPGIPLYMDQVVLYLTDLLAPFQREDTPLLTSSMVNNYVKAGAIPRPEKKKYDRRHLSGLTVLCMLKQVLSLQDIKVLLRDGALAQEQYGLFLQAHHAAMEELTRDLQESLSQGRDPREEALRLAAEANAKRAAAEQLLLRLGRKDETPGD